MLALVKALGGGGSMEARWHPSFGHPALAVFLKVRASHFFCLGSSEYVILKVLCRSNSQSVMSSP